MEIIDCMNLVNVIRPSLRPMTESCVERGKSAGQKKRIFSNSWPSIWPLLRSKTHNFITSLLPDVSPIKIELCKIHHLISCNKKSSLPHQSRKRYHFAIKFAVQYKQEKMKQKYPKSNLSKYNRNSNQQQKISKQEFIEINSNWEQRKSRSLIQNRNEAKSNSTNQSLGERRNQAAN